MNNPSMLFDEHSSLLDTFPYPVFVKNERLEIIYGNAAFSDMLGNIEFLGKTDDAMFPPEQVDVFRTEDLRVLQGEESINEEEIGDDTLALTRKISIRLRDGAPAILGIIIVRASAEGLDSRKEFYEDKLLSFALSQESIKTKFDRKVAVLQDQLHKLDSEKAEAQRQAYTDELTGLKNRKGFERDLTDCMERYERLGTKFALFMLDLDHFKRINDRFGHAAGDEVLQTIASRIRKLPYVVSAARMGGDEFALISEHPMDDDKRLSVDVELARRGVFQPVTIDSKRIEISGSAGLSIFPTDADTDDMLRRHADAALFAAKRAGRARVQFYNSEIHAARERRERIEADLPDAIKAGKITPAYQPIVSSGDQTLNAMEVLARWNHPDLGPISPDEFVAIAIDCGLITDLDRCVRKGAYLEGRQWIESGLISKLSFNISPTDIISRGFATSFLKELRSANTDPSNVCIEILESAIVENTREACRNIERLSEAGVRIALDDFGTGYSNLRALIDLPLDCLKIDRSLIKDVGDNDKLTTLISAITQLSEALDVYMVAEGIETDQQLMFVESMGCQYCQGYMFAKPMAFNEADDYVKQAVLPAIKSRA